jgi:hypothetical protein
LAALPFVVMALHNLYLLAEAAVIIMDLAHAGIV